MDRRNFIKLASTGVAASLVAQTLPGCTNSDQATKGRVVVVGGGFAGSTVAKYIRKWSEGAIEVVVVEPNDNFISCPLSNLVLGGNKTIDDLTFSYDTLKKTYGIEWVKDMVTAIDIDKKTVTMQHGDLSYDRLIVAPGIDFMYDNMPALADIEVQKQIPHAWKAGWQTVNLRKQLEAMHDGGVVAMHIPPTPYRCPPGPYERASQIACYLKEHKPKSKLIVLDTNANIVSKRGLFEKVFTEQYGDIIDYRTDQALVSVDVKTKTVVTDFDEVKADVLNVIPPQRAGKIAQMAQLNNIDNRWCEVDFLTYESAVAKDVHVLGDAISAGTPKSGQMATNTAKVCANAVVQLMMGNPVNPDPIYSNTCYSFVNDKEAIHVAAMFRYDPEKGIMVKKGGTSLSPEPAAFEARDANYWAKHIWTDVLS